MDKNYTFAKTFLISDQISINSINKAKQKTKRNKKCVKERINVETKKIILKTKNECAIKPFNARHFAHFEKRRET